MTTEPHSDFVCYRTAPQFKRLIVPPNWAKDFHNGVMSYNALDTDDMLGEDIFPDDSCGSIEDMVISHVLIAQLRTYMAKLSNEDQLLLKLSFFDELPEHKIAERTGLPKSTVNYHKARAIKRLREYFNI